jgi:hypothetical protein
MVPWQRASASRYLTGEYPEQNLARVINGAIEKDDAFARSRRSYFFVIPAKAGIQ